ncbi:MAG: penicillin acylase family protein, partial [Caulobacterales bacterium]|nr:penicillin acylase family protein [Caulobacterales bacterium]
MSAQGFCGRLLIGAALAVALSACATLQQQGWTGDYAEPGQREILWDSYGVPHVYADEEAAVFHGYGWAQAHSHGDLILRLYGQARGRGAEYWGEDYLSTDLWLLTNGAPERGAAWYEAQTPQFRANLDAFAQGINDYAAARPDAIDPEV